MKAASRAADVVLIVLTIPVDPSAVRVSISMPDEPLLSMLARHRDELPLVCPIGGHDTRTVRTLCPVVSRSAPRTITLSPALMEPWISTIAPCSAPVSTATR